MRNKSCNNVGNSGHDSVGKVTIRPFQLMAGRAVVRINRGRTPALLDPVASAECLARSRLLKPRVGIILVIASLMR